MSERELTNEELWLAVDNMLIQLNTINAKLSAFTYHLKEMSEQAQSLKTILRNKEAQR